MYWNTVKEIVEADPKLAVIPVGSVEQHGPHLPVMTDWAIASELGKRVALKMNAFCLPALPISTCKEHMGKKGSVWMAPMTFYQMLEDIVSSLKVQGFKKVAILQCHGGIFVLPPLVRELNAKYNPDLMVALIDICNFFGQIQENGLVETSEELHAGEIETSQVLALAPETVHMDWAEDFVPAAPRAYLNYGSIFHVSENGVWGQPSYASAEKGEKIFAYCADMAVEELNKAFSFMEEKKKQGYSDF